MNKLEIVRWGMRIKAAGTLAVLGAVGLAALIQLRLNKGRASGAPKDAKHAGSADAKLCRDGVPCKALRLEAHNVSGLASCGRGATLVLPLSLGLGDALSLPLKHQVALKGGDAA